MAHTHARTRSAATNSPHSLSLKVLRLSRPSLSVQTPLPTTTFSNGLDIPLGASLAYPHHDRQASNSAGGNDDADSVAAGVKQSRFPLTPLLQLPPAFGAAYVGEEFTCTLCANNDVLPDGFAGENTTAGAGRRVRDVRIVAEMLVPGREEGVPVRLLGAEDLAGEGHEVEVEKEEGEAQSGDFRGEFLPGATMQRTLRYELKEEGPHQLAVTVTYVESPGARTEGGEDEGRTRTFKKLYQFVAQPLIAVRSKVTERRRRDTRKEERQWVLEAQLENVGEVSVVLERVWVNMQEGIASSAVNGRPVKGEDGEFVAASAVVLKPQDVEQVMFLLSEEPGVRKLSEEDDDGLVGVGRIALAQVNVDWRAAMGEKGSLTTGWLATRRR